MVSRQSVSRCLGQLSSLASFLCSPGISQATPFTSCVCAPACVCMRARVGVCVLLAGACPRFLPLPLSSLSLPPPSLLPPSSLSLSPSLLLLPSPSLSLLPLPPIPQASGPHRCRSVSLPTRVSADHLRLWILRGKLDGTLVRPLWLGDGTCCLGLAPCLSHGTPFLP